MIKTVYKYKATATYIFLIIFVNSLFSHLPLVNILGQRFSPADVLVGSTYIFRDFSQREIKSYVLIAMLVGGLLSYFFAENTVAFASISAFFAGELIDWAIFTWTQKPLSQRLLLSSVCSCPIDTIIFLGLIGRLTWMEFAVMTLFKFLGIFWVWGYWQMQQRKQLANMDIRTKSW
ncbi:MAG: VUT family protein [Gammaproteobacteria bacterium]|nr:VUT family protein [Gammaproteobacteria bacterium]